MSASLSTTMRLLPHSFVEPDMELEEQGPVEGRWGDRVVDDIEDVLACLRTHGAELAGEQDQNEDGYRLGHVRGPEGVIVALASSSAEGCQRGRSGPDNSQTRSDRGSRSQRAQWGSAELVSASSATLSRQCLHW
jgi:hypothetical protein